MQKEILEKYPDSQVRVYAVWFNIIQTDQQSRWKWTAGVLDDHRVIHIWDEQKTVGRLFAKEHSSWGDTDNNVLLDEDTLWDTFFVFDGEAIWQTNPPKPLSWGATIDNEQEKLHSTLLPLLTAK